MSYNKTFKEYLEESNKIPNDFKININSIDYIVKREYHVRQPRGNMNFPRDAGKSFVNAREFKRNM